MSFRAFLGLLLLTFSAAAPADTALQGFLDQTLTQARDKQGLPAIAALVQLDGKVAAQSAIGIRAVGQPAAVTLQDRWHLGADTTAFTATVIARLVEQGFLKFEDTLAQAFPGVAKDMDPAYRQVTLLQLLSHTAGLPPLTDGKLELPRFMAVIKPYEGVRQQRSALAIYYLGKPPASKSGEFAFSNLGYIIAAAIAEARMAESWENLVRREVFKPLGIRNAGFGPPGKPGKFDQPLGHEQIDDKFTSMDPATMEADNPAAFGPAGRINITLGDWLLFAQDQLDGAHGRGKLLKPEGYKKLHTPVARNFALGWGVIDGADGTIAMLAHTGSNGMWVADIRISPRRNSIVLTAMNAGGASAEQAVRDVGKAINERLKPFD